VVANKYNHAGGVSALTFRTGDNYRRISYLGAPWIIDAKDAAKAKAIIDQSGWAAVDVHVAQVPFKAPVHRELKGTPPKIALMNSNESLTGGNARILESYLRLAGICNDVYEVVTPNQIRDGILTNGAMTFSGRPTGTETPGWKWKRPARREGYRRPDRPVSPGRQRAAGGVRLHPNIRAVRPFSHHLGHR